MAVIRRMGVYDINDRKAVNSSCFRLIYEHYLYLAPYACARYKYVIPGYTNARELKPLIFLL